MEMRAAAAGSAASVQQLNASETRSRRIGDIGRLLRLVVRKLVLVRRHRHQARRKPHGAQRRNHCDIHDDPHGPTPRFDHPTVTPVEGRPAE
jgi:predicted component of type VI protein secretion system